jgi:acetylornithine aminotransferase
MPDTGFERGDHATTFGGSPPIAAAALAVLDAIEREGLVENARALGEHIAARAGVLPGVDHVRGAGLLLGIELSGAPAAEVAEALRTRGILVNAITPTALRLVPPLCLTEGEADRFCASLEAVLAARHDQHATTVA